MALRLPQFLVAYNGDAATNSSPEPATIGNEPSNSHDYEVSLED
jgi:hypothetical protein